MLTESSLAVQGQPETLLGHARVAEGGDQGVVVALVMHQVPHVEHALHRVRLARARRALDEQEGQRLRAGGRTGQGCCPQMASCRLQVLMRLSACVTAPQPETSPSLSLEMLQSTCQDMSLSAIPERLMLVTMPRHPAAC